MFPRFSFLRRSLNMFAVLGLLIGAVPLAAQAQDAGANTAVPELPDPLKNLQADGAQMRFLGKDGGLDGWVAIKNGQEQYFYVLPGGKMFLSGVLIGDDGRIVTVDQVKRLRTQGDDTLDQLAGVSADSQSKPKQENIAFKSPSERLYYDIENSNWLPFGQAGAPIMYVFVDPQCPHCHDLMKALKDKIDQGKVQVRLIPVGFKDETRAQAAFLLATPNPYERWYKHLAGDKDALPARAEINQQGVQRNLAIMQSWKFDATPTTIYRAADGTVKLLRGQPNDMDALIADLGARS